MSATPEQKAEHARAMRGQALESLAPKWTRDAASVFGRSCPACGREDVDESANLWPEDGPGFAFKCPVPICGAEWIEEFAPCRVQVLHEDEYIDVFVAGDDHGPVAPVMVELGEPSTVEAGADTLRAWAPRSYLHAATELLLAYAEGAEDGEHPGTVSWDDLDAAYRFACLSLGTLCEDPRDTGGGASCRALHAAADRGWLKMRASERALVELVAASRNLYAGWGDPEIDDWHPMMERLLAALGPFDDVQV